MNSRFAPVLVSSLLHDASNHHHDHDDPTRTLSFLRAEVWSGQGSSVLAFLASCFGLRLQDLCVGFGFGGEKWSILLWKFRVEGLGRGFN